MHIELPPELEARLQQEADRRGIEPTEYAKRLLENSLPPRFLTARELLRLPREEQDRYLAAAAEDAAPLYAADLALPPAERELTAFTALDCEPFFNYGDEKNGESEAG